MAHAPFFLVVSGSRHFNNPSLLTQHLAAALQKQPHLVIVSGGARGCDALAQAWARTHHVPCLVVPAQWHRYGKAAGPLRNRFMLSVAHGLLAFPLAGSRGTTSIIKAARKAGIPTRVVSSQ